MNRVWIPKQARIYLEGFSLRHPQSPLLPQPVRMPLPHQLPGGLSPKNLRLRLQQGLPHPVVLPAIAVKAIGWALLRSSLRLCERKQGLHNAFPGHYVRHNDRQQPVCSEQRRETHQGPIRCGQHPRWALRPGLQHALRRQFHWYGVDPRLVGREIRNQYLVKGFSG